jgi:hypothetical protein
MTAIYAILGAILAASTWMLGNLLSVNRKLTMLQFALFGDSLSNRSKQKHVFPICDTIAAGLQKIEELNQKLEEMEEKKGAGT